MNPELPYALAREGLQTLAVASGPLLVAMLVTGVLIGIVQAATQINDPAASFLPRFLVGLLMLWLLGGWSMERMARFFAHAVQQMSG
jgi:flagellar biosynthetic protein FliQ